MQDLNLFGLLFESMVVRDMRVYAQSSDAEIRQYHDNTGLEIDIIVEAVDGRWAAFEVKLGTRFVEEGAANLLKFADRIDVGRRGPPAILAVITGMGYCYNRDDGVVVIPVGVLGP